jgi:hypothetical protein
MSEPDFPGGVNVPCTVFRTRPVEGRRLLQPDRLRWDRAASRRLAGFSRQCTTAAVNRRSMDSRTHSGACAPLESPIERFASTRVRYSPRALTRVQRAVSLK